MYVFCLFLPNKMYIFARQKPKTIYMEQLLHYVWKHKLFPLSEMTDSDGHRVEVVDPGLHNHNAGPDFFNAKVVINGTEWIGNVEIHDRSSDWYLHGHERDAQYNNVVLHVVGEIDRDVQTLDGRFLPQLCLPVPDSVRANYEELLAADKYPPCHRIIPDLTRLTIHSWMSALETERLERKTIDIKRRANDCNGDWESAYFITLARSFGFGINSDAFEQWARHLPLSAAAHHRDNLFQIEALFMGQAGLLDASSMPDHHRQAALSDDYFLRLKSEYQYLCHKFRLSEPSDDGRDYRAIDYRQWRFLRLRPHNFPYIRISQLVNLYYQRRTRLSDVISCATIKEVQQLLRIQVTPYWETHYAFGTSSTQGSKELAAASLNIIMINTVVPVLFAYGRHKSDERLCDRAFDFLEQLKAEDNTIVRMWQQCGLPVNSAGDSQALIQLKTAYCDRKECLRCRIGYEYMKR